MLSREIVKIQQKISQLNLNLEGFEILTEVATGLYNYMPLIPLLAGAKKVMAWTRDSKHGVATDIIENCRNAAQGLPNLSNLEFYVGQLNEKHLSRADMITNSGFIRPLNESNLKFAKDSAVVPLMFEAWEARKEDVDLDYCNRRGIKVAGTNESHEDLNVFPQVGHLAAKMVFEAGFEIYGNKIAIWSDDDFGQVIQKTFCSLGADEVTVTTDFEKLVGLIPNLDFLFISDYDEARSYDSPAFFDLDRLSELNRHFGIVHLFGEIDSIALKKKGLNVYPSENGIAKYMSRTLSHLGINPFFSLMVGGFKVGENLLRGKTNDELSQVLT
jgi:hypothetical protein